jgi:hypothetical protein
VAVPPQTLEALVRDELRAPVQEIVRRLIPELVAEALNSTTPAPAAANGAVPATRACKTCGQELPLDRFAPHSHECKRCRNARYPRNRRARGTAAAASETEPPRTSEDPD